MKIKIGVMGSAQGPSMGQKENRDKARLVGEAIAEHNCILVNGACPGLPHEAAIGAKKADGFVLGISPAFSLWEHIHKYKSPNGKTYNIILFTGAGLMQRDITNIRSSDAIIILGGGIGTLNEFTVAFDEGRFIGVLTGSSGISDHIPKIVKLCNRELGDRVILDDDPKRLVHKLIGKVKHGERFKIADQRIVGKKHLEHFELDDSTPLAVKVAEKYNSHFPEAESDAIT